MKNRFACRLAIVSLALFAFAGCGPSKYAKNYVLDFPSSAAAVVPPSGTHGTLSVREFQCPLYLCEGRIVYRPTAEEIGFYEFHRWATNPRNMVTQFVADSIRARGVFKTVTLQESGVDSAYVLKGSIDRLEEVDGTTNVQVICTISAQLVDAHSKSIIWSQTASQTVAVQNRTVAGIVNGLSSAVRMSVDNLVRSLEDTLSATGS